MMEQMATWWINLLVALQNIETLLMKVIEPVSSFCWALFFLSILNIKLIVWPAASRLAVQRFSVTPYITPRFTPSGTPKIFSTGGSPRGYSAVASPNKTSGATSPTKSQYDGRGALSSWYPSSQQSSAANSPPRARPLPGSEKLLLFSSILRIIIILWITACPANRQGEVFKNQYL